MNEESVCIHISQPRDVDDKLEKQMTFIYNALQDGWSVVKKIDYYVFEKKHEGKKEILSDDYLKTFISNNFSLKQ
jgi:hypothetical protein